MASYIAIIHKQTDSDYGVSFPDFPGCITAGATLDEARAMAQDALELHTDFMRKQGQELPVPMTLEAANQATQQDDPEGFNATLVITLKEDKPKVERVNITVPKRDLARIDRYAAAHGLSRSAFLVQAARQVMHRGQ